MTSDLDRAVHAAEVSLWMGQLRTARVNRGLSRRQLAERIGVGITLLRNWENRAHQPGVANLMSWASALGFELQMVPVNQSQEME